jgi:hypothetical protein
MASGRHRMSQAEFKELAFTAIKMAGREVGDSVRKRRMPLARLGPIITGTQHRRGSSHKVVSG